MRHPFWTDRVDEHVADFEALRIDGNGIFTQIWLISMVDVGK